MASITIRNLDEELKARLRVRAARHGRSMEEEVRDLLRSALAKEETRRDNLLVAIRKRFAGVGPVELPIPERQSLREPPEFDE